MAALMAEYVSATTYSSRILSSNDKSIYTEVEIDLRDSITVKVDDNQQIQPDELFALLRSLNLINDVFGVQKLTFENNLHRYEINLKTGVEPKDFITKFFAQPAMIGEKQLSSVTTRKMKDRIRNPITKVLLFEAPFQMPDEYILKTMKLFGNLQSNVIQHQKYRGTDIYNGVRSFNFKKIHNPIPTVIFVHGSKIKTRHEGQDRSAICSICKQRGHFRTECPELPKIQEMLDKDSSPEDPDPPEMRSWEQARKFIELSEIQKKEEQKKKEWERKEQERLKRLEEEEQHRRDMLSGMSRRPAP